MLSESEAEHNGLHAYVRQLAQALNSFAEGAEFAHQIVVRVAPDITVCTVELVLSPAPAPQVRFSRSGAVIAACRAQWKPGRNLRLFDGPYCHLCKASHRRNWSPARAQADADDLIAEVLCSQKVKANRPKRAEKSQ